MTDARLRSEWLNTLRFDDLSDTAWRVFTGALMWSAGNSTDGIVPTRYLRMLHPEGNQWDACNEIERAGLWTKTEEGYVFDDWDGMLGQSTAAQVDAYKANARDRQRKYREKNRQTLVKKVEFTDAPVTRDVTSPVTRDVGKGEGEGEGAGITKVPDIQNNDDNPETWGVVAFDETAGAGDTTAMIPAPEVAAASGERPGWERDGNGWRRVRSA